MAVTLGVAALALTLVPMMPAAAEGCGPHRVNTFHVHVAAKRDVVRLGSAAELEVTVARSVAHQDFAPAEEANVLVVVSLGDTAVGGSGMTDAAGLAPVLVDLPRRVGTGLADVTAFATHQPVYCLEEYGEATEKGLFRVRN